MGKLGEKKKGRKAKWNFSFPTQENAEHPLGQGVWVGVVIHPLIPSQENGGILVWGGGNLFLLTGNGAKGSRVYSSLHRELGV